MHLTAKKKMIFENRIMYDFRIIFLGLLCTECAPKINREGIKMKYGAVNCEKGGRGERKGEDKNGRRRE